MSLLCGFDKRRTLQRSSSSLALQAHRLLDLPSISAMTRQQFRLVLCNPGEPAFEGLGDASMKGTSALAQQYSVCRILYKCVLEQISRVRRQHPA